MLTATEKRRTIGERPAEDHGLEAPAADEASTVGAQLESGSTYRDGHDCGAALPVHLLLLRDALADTAGRHRGTSGDGRAEHRHMAPCRRSPARTDGAPQLTLSQWVSRTARIGDQS
ncbi:zf-HC2 domain-containing protein [Streptomyces sp. NPDC015032]|uniref:zf-HC2 domain-containing protein n=1 Tax=Streptomyces sp. NPDC015032 TaxID=3364937 RepID=UPI0036F4D0D8